MNKKYSNKVRSLAFLLLACVSMAQAERTVRLEPATGTESEYAVAELLRVELAGDSIRFIAKDGSLAAEVYKYDYVRMTFEENEEQAVEEATDMSRKLTARKILHNGQVYILFGDKAYLISGQATK
jgi:hypothetical protein